MNKTLPPSKDKEFWGEDSETTLIKEPEKVYKAEKGHRWIQQGPYLVCKSCVLKHSVYIGMDKKLVGYNKDSTPKLEKY